MKNQNCESDPSKSEDLVSLARSGSSGSFQGKLSPEEISVHGNIAIRKGILWLVGGIDAILAIGGLGAWYINPDKSKDLWVILGPIISASLAGVVGFIAGEGQGANKRRR